jgi:uncharacterized protein YegP (UPF0339 family)
MVKSMRTVLALLALAVFLTPMSLDSAAAQKADKEAKAAHFEVYKDRGGKFRFRFYDSEGEEVAMAVRGYDAKADCQKAIDALKKDAAKAKVTDEEKEKK